MLEDLIKDLSNEILEVKKELTALRRINSYTSLTYGEWLTQWLELYKKPNIKYNYYCNLTGYVKNYLRPAFDNRPLIDLTSFELQSFLLSIPLNCTRTQVSAVISGSLRKAYELRMIPFNPYLAVSFAHYEQPSLGALTHRQYVELLQSIQDRKKYILTYMLLVTGLRQGEALALTLNDIDFERKIIRVRHSLERVTLNFVKPKTKSGIRSIPICEPLISYLKEIEVLEGRIFYENTPDSLSRYYRRLFARIGLDFSGHILRHTFITNAYELEIPDYIVQRWVGHSKREQSDAYLALRKAKDFEVTEIVEYMLKLKDTVVPCILRT